MTIKGCVLLDDPHNLEGDPNFSYEFPERPNDAQVLARLQVDMPHVYSYVHAVKIKEPADQVRTISVCN